MDIFATLGDILRPENSQPKTEYLIYEKLSECTLRYQRVPGGIIAVDTVTAESPDKAIRIWLSEKSEVYQIGRDKETDRWYEDCSGRLVWEPGDWSAEFGDFIVLAFPLADVESGSLLEQACIKAGIINSETI